MFVGSHAGLLLKMLQEEVCRAKGRKWSTVMRRVSRNISLIMYPSYNVSTREICCSNNK